MRLSGILGKSLYFDGERWFLVPDDEPQATRGHEAWTVGGEERRLTPDQFAAYEVDEAAADAFILQETQTVTQRLMPVLIEVLTSMKAPPDPAELRAVLEGFRGTLNSVARGDQAAIERFRERAARVAGVLEERGRHEMADIVRRLPETIAELFRPV